MINDPRRNLVKIVAAPNGSDPNPEIIHTFVYDIAPYYPGFSKVSVFHADQSRTDYYPNDQIRLQRIEHFDVDGHRLAAQQFQWAADTVGDCLASKMDLDGDLKPISFTHYRYDPRGNVLEQKFCVRQNHIDNQSYCPMHLYSISIMDPDKQKILGGKTLSRYHTFFS